MQKTVYTHAASGQSWDCRLPKILRWNGISTSNITEDNMAQCDECRGAGTDPWTAVWETAWEDEWQGTVGNQGPVPTVTGTEA